MKDRISITMLEDGIADVRLIRADKMNALDAAMWAALAEAIDELKAKHESGFPLSAAEKNELREALLASKAKR